MKWFYFYTADYTFWHDHLQRALGGQFDLQPILIRELELSSQEGRHHFTGQPLKLQLLVNAVKENQGESIVFSDCTLFINREKVIELRRYMEIYASQSDLAFADNTLTDEVNIGLVLMNCSVENCNFWERCLEQFDDDSWDQELVNRTLRESGINHALFDVDRVVCNYEFNHAYKKFILRLQTVYFLQ